MKTITITLLMLLSSLAFGQEPRAATLAQQKMCSDQAKKVFQDWDTTTGHKSFTSHYSPKANVCYVWLSAWTSGDKFARIEEDSVVDAFEGREYANRLFIQMESGEVGTDNCYVSHAQITEHCTSHLGFGILVEKAFGVAQ